MCYRTKGNRNRKIPSVCVVRRRKFSKLKKRYCQILNYDHPLAPDACAMSTRSPQWWATLRFLLKYAGSFDFSKLVSPKDLKLKFHFCEMMVNNI